MLPTSGSELSQEFKIRKQPSKTFRLKDGRIRDCTDGLEAVRQSIYCILNTERFDYLIYSWNYGVELSRLYGKSPGLVRSKIKKRIQQALRQDDRIRSVGAFSFTQKRERLHVTFTVRTELGMIEAETEVKLNV